MQARATDLFLINCHICSPTNFYWLGNPWSVTVTIGTLRRQLGISRGLYLMAGKNWFDWRNLYTEGIALNHISKCV